MARTIQEIEAARAKRKAELEAGRLEQLAVDLEALDALELELGDGRVVRVDLERYFAGLPTLVAARLPSGIEFKRYQDRIKGKGDKPGDPIMAANELADVCVVYPAADVYAKIRELAPALHVSVAVAAINAAGGKAAEEGKG